MTVAQLVSVSPKPGKEGDVERLLRQLVASARQLDGALLFVLNRHDDGFVLYEMYADEDARAVISGDSALQELMANAGDLLAAAPKSEQVCYLDGTADIK